MKEKKLSTKNTNNTKSRPGGTNTNPYDQVNDLKLKLSQLRLEIKAGKNTNTNAHKPLKKQIAQLLTELANRQ